MTKFNPYDDIDPVETNEWLESIDSVLTHHGPERAHFLIEALVDKARFQSEAALRQAEYESTAWQDRVIK